MKIRTDFVTNSSSSSFIFKEYNPKKIKEAIGKRISVPPRDEWEKQSFEWLREQYVDKDGLGKKRFKEYEIQDLMEVFGWYREEVIANILGIKYCSHGVEYDKWCQNVIEELDKRIYEENCMKWTALFILDLYDEGLYYSDFRKNNEIYVSYDFISSQVWEFMSSWDGPEEIVREFYIKNLDKLMLNVKEFEGKHLGDVMEILFDAQYLYFDDLETHYLIVEALEKSGLCLYSCGHMG